MTTQSAKVAIVDDDESVRVATDRLIRVLVVDDHPLLRGAITALLQSEPDIYLCGEAEDAGSALLLINTTNPQIVLLDISLKETDSFELLKEIRTGFPAVKVLIFSAKDEYVYGPLALRFGASGYIEKTQSHLILVPALRKIAEGGVYFSNELQPRLMKGLSAGHKSFSKSPVELLTDRELQVFNLIGKGLGTNDTAAELHVSKKTIEAHHQNIQKKLGLENGNEMRHMAIHWIGKCN
ncbi:MAG: two component transcriptional regulator, LuxR family [Verrucomicrobiales bacterium]|nr:two component transcriptional regulator, LuxR family [Verrucomicrobiales bacterium]